MAELLTFGEAKTSRLRDIAQSCPNSDDFKSLVNDATEILMRRGGFWGTVVKVRVCTYNGCLTWPRFVGTVLATSIFGHDIPVWNNWWDFMPMNPTDFSNGTFSFAGGSCHGNVNTINDGVVPVFNPIACGSSQYIRIFASYQADLGKTVTLYGLDSNGQTVRTKTVDGLWQEGLTMILGAPYVQTTIKFTEITRISKDVTQGPVRYYQVDPASGLLQDLVSHEPTEKNPYYRHSKIRGLKGPGTNCGSSCAGLKSVQAMVQQEFVPVEADSDLIQIPCIQALKNMIMSLRQEEAGNADKAVAFEAKAIHELNLQIRQKFPNSQLPANVQCYGTARLEKQMIGPLI